MERKFNKNGIGRKEVKVPNKYSAGTLKIVCWNIDGFNSADFGNKLEDKDFLSVVEGYDIITLIETHSANDDLSIPGFCKPLQLNRPKNGNKAFGGIAVFIKMVLWENKTVVEVRTDNADVLWVRIKCGGMDQCGSEQDIYVGSVYLNPENRTIKKLTKPLLHNLSENIVQKRQCFTLRGF